MARSVIGDLLFGDLDARNAARERLDLWCDRHPGYLAAAVVAVWVLVALVGGPLA